MNKAIGAACLAVGVILLIFGLNAGDSFASELKETFTGNPTNRAMWLTLGGVALLVIGLVSVVRGGRASTT
jgi:hypothetical protein